MAVAHTSLTAAGIFWFSVGPVVKTSLGLIIWCSCCCLRIVRRSSYGSRWLVHNCVRLGRWFLSAVQFVGLGCYTRVARMTNGAGVVVGGGAVTAAVVWLKRSETRPDRN